jgi:protein-disulfide isomerase
MAIYGILPYFDKLIIQALLNMDNEQPNLSRRERREQERQQQRDNYTKSVSGRKWRNISIIAVIIIGVGLLVAALASGNKGSSNAAPVDTVAANDWTKGQTGSSKIFMVFSDFQCPACAAYEPWLNQAMTEFKDSVQFVFRDFPLRSIHPNAQIGAQAAEAAGLQNKFWEMHDLLFEKQTEWSTGNDPKTFFSQYVETLGLDKTQFENDLNSDVVIQRVEDDYQSGLKANVQGTPTFFLNGKKLANFQSYDELKSALSK